MGPTLVITVMFIINVAFCFAFGFRGGSGFCIRHLESKVCDTASIQIAWCLGNLFEKIKASLMRHLRNLPSCYCFRCSVFAVVTGLGSVSALTTALRSTLHRAQGCRLTRPRPHLHKRTSHRQDGWALLNNVHFIKPFYSSSFFINLLLL